jgi:cell division transport system ATP-binding protein
MIRLEGVTKVYEGGTAAIRGVSVEIGKGQFVFLVGPSGSGKSTLVRLLLREEEVTRGNIWVAGKDITKLPRWKIPQLRRSVGTVFQDFKLLPSKTVYENVAFALEVLGHPRGIVQQQVRQVVELVGLAGKGDRYPDQLSGGEQQRVSIARSFVNRPPILLADEPTGNLDPATSVGIMRLLDRINRTGTTIVMATHDHAIVDAMRRRVIALDQGRIVSDVNEGSYDDTMTHRTVQAPQAAPEPKIRDVAKDAPVPAEGPREKPEEPPSDRAQESVEGAQAHIAEPPEEPTT